MHWIDWLIIVLPLTVCGVIAIYSRRYVHGVADFMAGGRNAGRFLVCTARSEQGAGAVVFVALFQMFCVSGFTLTWWQQISVPTGLFVAISGFVIYRYRQTRAMTLGQFFEMRYSRRFRLFAGGLALFAGLTNFGIIPVIGARFMVYFLELPQTLHLFSHDVPTYLLLMAIFLTICVVMTTTGGQVTILLTNCAEGMISQIFYVFIATTLLIVFFKWSDTREMLLATKPGESLVNPFDSFGLKDFNIWFALIGIFGGIYGTMAWQNNHAFNASAATPHESRMGSILTNWRSFAAAVMITLLAVCALTYLHSSKGAASVQTALDKISDRSTADQMRVPIALSQLLPIGVKGALVSICLMGIVAGDGIHLHSWGSIFIQDVVLPMRKKPLSPKQHIVLLRLAIVGVAVWAFLFGVFFPQTEYVSIWWMVTSTIYVGGAGAVIICGLYWNRGTTAGAWTGLLTGSILSVGGIGLRIYYQTVLGREFPINGQYISFGACVLALASYGVISLLTCKEPHNMDRLLHRGKYAVASDATDAQLCTDSKRVGWLQRIVGVDEDFSRSDRWITYGIFIWSITWFVVFAIGSAAYLIHPWSNAVWADYWLVTGIFLPLLIGIVTTVWFTIGCWHDMRVFFRRLGEEQIDVHDDGTVVHNNARPHNAPAAQTRATTENELAATGSPGSNE